MLHLLPIGLIHPTWCLPLILVGLLLIAWWKVRTNDNQENRIPSISVIPYVYNCMKYCTGSVNILRPTECAIPILSGLSNLYYKHKMVQGMWGCRNYILCFEASTCESILKSSVALNKDWTYDIMKYWIGSSVFNCTREKWKIRRKMLNPAFYFQILKDFLPIFNEQSMILINKLKECSGQEINIDKYLELCTLDIIGETAMGVHLKAQENKATKYINASNNLTTIFIKWFLTPWYWITWIFFLTPTGKAVKKDLFTVHGFSSKVILDRKATFLRENKSSEAIKNFEEEDEYARLKERKPFLDLLLHHHIRDKSLSMEDVREEVDTFISGGHNTMAMGISWTLYLLGLHEDIQGNVYQEIRSVFGDDKERSVTTDDLKEVKYLECVIKETLRVFPPTPIIMRRTTEAIKSGPYTIPANSSMIISIYDLHRDPAIFPNPEVFDPSRFLPENCSGRHPFAYIPFSAGPRNCIGQRFAMMETKTVLINIIRNFKFHSLDHRDKIMFSESIVLHPKHGLRLIPERR